MARFYEDLPSHADFHDLVDPACYVPLPDDWLIGVADVVNSTGAIAEGRYKSVNMAGATVIAALSNALGTLRVPFVFGGDGAHFAVPPEEAETARKVLAQSVVFVQTALDLALRAALVPMRELRAAGRDVAVARFAASPAVSYAMFRGGGLEYAEAVMKRGEFLVLPAAVGDVPDLTGLSCRWNPVPARNGIILSLIALPMGYEDAGYRAAVDQVLELAATPGQASRPIGDPQSVTVRWPPEGVAAEAMTRPGWRRVPLLARLRLWGMIGVQLWLFARDRALGSFDPVRYRRDLVANADYRKYDDGLRLTLDCTPALADQIERVLAKAEGERLLRFGLHRQSSAIMTCFVPSMDDDGHVHFIDGADGGYAQAARQLKEKSG